MDRIIIFGGTFNPFHNGHLEMVKALLELDDICRVIIIPTCIPPHKSAPDLASGEDRLAMCRIAVSGLQRVAVSDIELTRAGKSFTYDTVCELKAKTKSDISIACGGDMITTLHTWYRYGNLIKEANIIAFRRVGIDGEDFDKAVKNISDDGGNVTVMETAVTNISSTRIREDGVPYVPQGVLEYIKEKGLYNLK